MNQRIRAAVPVFVKLSFAIAVLAVTLASGNGFSFTAGDFNSDGKTDLIVSDTSTNVEFSILLGNGDGTFQPQTAVKITPEDATGELGITVGDFNSDGLLDFMLEGAWEYLQVKP
jgi:hypothetical protein